MAINYNANTVSVGNDYTWVQPDKYVKLDGIGVNGLITVPVKTFSTTLVGDGITPITAASTISGTPTHIIIPGFTVTNDAVNDVYHVNFSIGLQCNYLTNGVLGLATAKVDLQVDIARPADMTAFQVSSKFIPKVSSVAAASTFVTLNSTTNQYEANLDVSLATFNIPASGTSTVNVLLAKF